MANGNWIERRWYCPICGHLVIGNENKLGVTKTRCRSCKVFILRRRKNKHWCIYELCYSEEF